MYPTSLAFFSFSSASFLCVSVLTGPRGWEEVFLVMGDLLSVVGNRTREHDLIGRDAAILISTV